MKIPRIAYIAAVAVVLALLFCHVQLRHIEAQNADLSDRDITVKGVISSPVEVRPKVVACDLTTLPQGLKLRCFIARNSHAGIHTAGAHSDSAAVELLREGDGIEINTSVSDGSSLGDYHRYLFTHGYVGSAYVRCDGWQPSAVVLTGLPLMQRIRLTFLRWRRHLVDRFLRVADSPRQRDVDAAAVIVAMTVGDRHLVTNRLRSTYAAAGTAHLLALSGLHLGILFGVVKLIRHVRLRHRAEVVMVVAVWLFVLLAGMPKSLVRAASMLTVLTLFCRNHSRGTPIASLSVAVIAMVTVSPMTVYDVGFQLSVASVAAIIATMSVLDQVVDLTWREAHPVRWWLTSAVAVSVAAQVGVAPLVMMYFGQLPVYFLLANLIVVPVMGVTLLVCCVALVAAWGPLATLALWLVDAINALLTAVASLPLSTISTPEINGFQVCLLYIIIMVVYAMVRYLAVHRRLRISR